MKWTDQLNEFIVRAYYRVTNLEEEIHGFRTRLHEEFIARFPELRHLTEQRIADQYRVIIRNNRVPQPTRLRIRQEVERELNRQNNTTPQVPRRSRRSTIVLRISNANQSLNVQESSELDQEATDVFQEALTEYGELDAFSRPTLPKLRFGTATLQIVAALDRVLCQVMEEGSSLELIHKHVYCAATAAIKLNGQTIQLSRQPSGRSQKYPRWLMRLTDRVEKLRCEIGRVTQALQGNESRKIQRCLEKVRRGYQLARNMSTAEILEFLKQKLAVVSNRKRRYLTSFKRKSENAEFAQNAKRFYRQLKGGVPDTRPEMSAAHQYWSSLWSRPASYNLEADWLTQLGEAGNFGAMDEPQITTEDVATAVRKMANWKAAGCDHLHCYWWKIFKSTHPHLAKSFQELLKGEGSLPEFLTSGITYLIPKDSDSTDPAKQRPITCLPTIYKVMTSVLSGKIEEFLTEENLLAEEQKGCVVGSRGCKEQLTIDTIVSKQAVHSHRNLHTAYIDYQKAFDSVSHSWLIRVLQVYKIHPSLVSLLRRLMSTWKTKLLLPTGVSPSIRVRRGIFQGDSLSPRWFCLALNPLSWLLKQTGYGFALKQGLFSSFTISHMMYMDDIKLYAKDDHQLKQMLDILIKFSADIGMTLGLDKCRTRSIHQGQLIESEAVSSMGMEITAMDCNELYKYLGMLQASGTAVAAMKEILLKKFNGRLLDILKTELTGGNKVKAINTFAIPVLTYSFGVLHWSTTELEGINRQIRVAMAKHCMMHRASEVERVTLRRSEGGRGLVDVRNMYYRQVDNLRKHFYSHQAESPILAAAVGADKNLSPLALANRTEDVLANIVTVEQKCEAWKRKPVHGGHIKNMLSPGIDRIASNKWLSAGVLFSETESFLIAIQDCAIPTRNNRRYVLQDLSVTNTMCRLCNRYTETIQHITSGCSMLAATAYTERHNAVCKIVHQKLALQAELLEESFPYYEYQPTSLLENEEVKLYWDYPIQTDHTVEGNRPDIILLFKKDKKCFLIDISVPEDRNTCAKHAEKIRKYIPLADDMKQTWRLNSVEILPIVVSATGLIPTLLHGCLKKLSLPPGIYIELQKAAILATCAIVRRTMATGSNEQ